jgi:fructose/tagatose bisphosphate aldolase
LQGRVEKVVDCEHDPLQVAELRLHPAYEHVVGHMLTNYDGVLKVDGEVGNKKAYDPRAWGKTAEGGMAKRVVEACEDLRSAGTTLSA